LNEAIIARMDQVNSHRGWDLWQSGTSLSVHIIDTWDGNALKVSTQQGVVTTGNWQHLFVTYDGSGDAAGVKIYIDGESAPLHVEKNNLRKDASIRAETPLRIGRRSVDAVFEYGLVQDVRIYDRHLGGDEVLSLAKDSVARAILAKAADERSPLEMTSLMDYYLSTRDPEFTTLSKKIATLEAERQAIQSRSPITHIQREREDSQPMGHILMRGAYDAPGEKVTANTPEALHPLPDGAPHNRLGLAMWVVDAANPLTPRVTVNRFWQEVFGQGLVTTAEDFGVTGAQPSHPELLDWLATDFVAHDWNVKRFFKQVFMSATYRQSAVTTPAKLEHDPDNVLLSRGPRYRMDAEMVRDTALAASGLLSPRMYGPGTRPYQPGDLWNVVGLPQGDTRNYVQDHGDNLYRRTLYNFWKRMAPPPSLEAFNAPSREICTVRRERTNTPLQALVTLNDPQFVEAARMLAQRALLASGGDEGMTLDYIAERLLARPLSVDEKAICLAAHGDFFEHYRNQHDDAKALLAVGESPVDKGLVDSTQEDTNINIPALAAWTMVCNEVMNLDETLNK